MRGTLRSGLVLVREVFSGVKGSCSCFDGYEKKKASKRKPFLNFYLSCFISPVAVLQYPWVMTNEAAICRR